MAVVKSMIMDRIESRMDILQAMMENQDHIEDPDKVVAQIQTITPYWSVLSDEDKDYIDCARWSIERKSEWLVP